MNTSPQPNTVPWIVVTGLDGAGKTTLVDRLTLARGAHRFRLPYHDFVGPALRRSGRGSPFADAHTDRLVFASDARLTNYLVREWRGSHRCLVSQRGWMDNFIFGAVQGVAYEETEAVLRAAELERISAAIFLVAEPDVAFERIRDDPGADKYETRPFLKMQYRETIHFYQHVQDALAVLAPFHGLPMVLIDTSARTTDDVRAEAERFLSSCDLSVVPGV